MICRDSALGIRGSASPRQGPWAVSERQASFLESSIPNLEFLLS